MSQSLSFEVESNIKMCYNVKNGRFATKGGILMRKHNKGFSLVELIIVIAIMAILVAVLAPQYIKYVAKSREGVCRANLSELERMCSLEFIFNDPSGLDDTAREAACRRIMAETLTTAGFADDGQGDYDGVCSGKGTVSIQYDGGYHLVYLECSEHGAVDNSTARYQLAFVNAVSAIAKINGTELPANVKDSEKFKKAQKLWTDYWTTGSDKRDSLDSTSTNNGSGSSYASQLQDFLSEAFGVDASKGSWRIYKKDSQFNVFLTETDVTTVPDQKTKFAVTKFDLTTDPPTKTTGTTVISSKSNGPQTYNIIDGSKFTADKK